MNSVVNRTLYSILYCTVLCVLYSPRPQLCANCTLSARPSSSMSLPAGRGPAGTQSISGQPSPGGTGDLARLKARGAEIACRPVRTAARTPPILVIFKLSLDSVSGRRADRRRPSHRHSLSDTVNLIKCTLYSILYCTVLCVQYACFGNCTEYINNTAAVFVSAGG